MVAIFVGCAKTMVFLIFLLFITATAGGLNDAVLYQINEIMNPIKAAQSDFFHLRLHSLRWRVRNRRDDENSSKSSADDGLMMPSFLATQSSMPLPFSSSSSKTVVAMTTSTWAGNGSHTETTYEDAASSLTEELEEGMTTPTSPTVQTTVESKGQNNFTIVEDDHRYYRSHVVSSNEQGGSYWVDEKTMYTASHHDTLSQSYRSAATIQLSFPFTFYGHEIKQVTVATGGFLYMSEFLHQWLTATQYIAPLMANFDTQLGNSSHIRYMDNGTVFVVWWEDVFLQDDHESGQFSFQVMLHIDGRIIFSYKQVPSTAPFKIPTQRHPVKVGLSDAYYVDKPTSSSGYDVRQRTIYEYHRVEINMSQVINNSVIIITPLPTCSTLKTCDSCVNQSSSVTMSFQCHWCPSVNRCSDGLDRNRQEWLKNNCDRTFADSLERCNEVENETLMASLRSLKGLVAPRGGISVTTGIVVAFVLFVIIGVVAWIVYAYRNPNSRSGLWLIEHRPAGLLEHLHQARSAIHNSRKYEVATQPEAESFA